MNDNGVSIAFVILLGLGLFNLYIKFLEPTRCEGRG